MFEQSVFARAPGLASLPTSRLSERARVAARLLLTALPFAWAIGYCFPPLNHDVAALLQFAQRMLGGERLYVDLIDINPPMVFLLDLVPAALARALGVPAVGALIGCVFVVCGVTTVWSLALLRRLHDGAWGRGGLGALLGPPLLGFALVVYPMYSFGQREHLLLAFCLPYAIAAAARAGGPGRATLPARHQAALALWALAGILLKPHFALVPLGVELVVLAGAGPRAWLRSPQPWLILAGCIGYVAATWIWLPDYFRVVVPLVAQCYEQTDLAGLLALLTQDQAPALLLPLLPLGIVALRLPEARLSRVLVALVLATTAAGIAQGKGWDYHFFAARAALALLVGALTVEGLAALRVRPGPWGGLGIAACLLAGLFAFTGVLSPPFKAPRNFANTAAGRFLPVVRAYAAGRPVLWLTTSIYPQFPVLNYTDSPLALRFMSLWVVPPLYGPADAPGGAMRYHDPAAMGAAETLVWRDVIAGLTRRHPALVLVAPAAAEGGFHGLPFDWLAYFGRDPAFAAEWQHYALLTTIDGIRVFRRVE